MGYCMSQSGQFFRIKNENLNKAFEALKVLFDTPHRFRWINNNSEIRNAGSFKETMRRLGWNIRFDISTGDVDYIMFEGEKAGEEEKFFGAIAPYVENESYIEMHGEDGGIWRWFFKNGKVEEQHAKVTF